jgi:L-serine dehydratase
VRTSIFEIFKMGIGPSSSHTMGPMRAAADFVATLVRREMLLYVKRVQIELYGSLALTGRGHGTDKAVLLGLCGELPDVIDPDTMTPLLQTIRSAGALPLRRVHPIQFDDLET